MMRVLTQPTADIGLRAFPDGRVKLWLFDPPWNCRPEDHDTMSDKTLLTVLQAINDDRFSLPDARAYMWCKYQDIGRIEGLAKEAKVYTTKIPLVVLYENVSPNPPKRGGHTPGCRAYPVMFFKRIGADLSESRHVENSPQVLNKYNVISVNGDFSRQSKPGSKETFRTEEKPVEALKELILRDSERAWRTLLINSFFGILFVMFTFILFL